MFLLSINSEAKNYLSITLPHLSYHSLKLKKSINGNLCLQINLFSSQEMYLTEKAVKLKNK
jgi:hypothetical protein